MKRKFSKTLHDSSSELPDADSKTEKLILILRSLQFTAAAASKKGRQANVINVIHQQMLQRIQQPQNFNLIALKYQIKDQSPPTVASKRLNNIITRRRRHYYVLI